MTIGKHPIIVLGLNPAWQKIMLFDEFNVAAVNRACEIFELPSGKGVNFAMAAENAGAECVVAQFSGGALGKRFLGDLEKRGVDAINREVDATTRTCVTLVTKGDPEVTEIIEPSGAVAEDDLQWLMERVTARIPECAGVALCGTSPPGVPASFHAALAETAGKHSKPIILDAYRNVEPILDTRAVSILKINRAEITALTRNGDIEKAARYLAEKFDIPIVAVTDGPGKALLMEDGNASWHAPPRTKCLNPIGAGDVVSAVLFVEILRGTPPSSAFDAALKAGSESCASILPAFAEKKR
jgi:tagatose 6-phosphate kinase